MSILFLSCYTPRYVYSPPAQNVATLTQKGDSRLAILYSTNAGSNNEIVEIGKATSNGLDVHSAYAISNHVITQFNFFYRNEQNSNRDNSNSLPELIRYKRNLAEMALGYFTPVNAGQKSFFYLMGSTGLGNFRFKDYDVNGNSVSPLADIQPVKAGYSTVLPPNSQARAAGWLASCSPTRSPHSARVIRPVVTSLSRSRSKATWISSPGASPWARSTSARWSRSKCRTTPSRSNTTASIAMATVLTTDRPTDRPTDQQR